MADPQTLEERLRAAASYEAYRKAASSQMNHLPVDGLTAMRAYIETEERSLSAQGHERTPYRQARLDVVHELIAERSPAMGTQLTEEVRADLETRFNYHTPTEEKKRRHETIRTQLKAAAMIVIENTPRAPEQTLAIRKLEEAMFWANAAIARYPG